MISQDFTAAEAELAEQLRLSDERHRLVTQIIGSTLHVIRVLRQQDADFSRAMGQIGIGPAGAVQGGQIREAAAQQQAKQAETRPDWRTAARRVDEYPAPTNGHHYDPFPEGGNG